MSVSTYGRSTFRSDLIVTLARTLSVRQVMPRLVRWISGTLVGSISFWKADSVYLLEQEESGTISVRN